MNKIIDGKKISLEIKARLEKEIQKSDIGINPNNDGKIIRRAAIDNNVAVFTCLDTVKVLLDVLEEITMGISVIDKE